MDRRTFLRRLGVGAIAIQALDGDALQAVFTEQSTISQVDVYRKGALVSSGTLDEILKTYYLPPVKEMLNKESFLLSNGGFGGNKAIVPLHFPREEYGKAVIHYD